MFQILGNINMDKNAIANPLVPPSIAPGALRSGPSEHCPHPSLATISKCVVQAPNAASVISPLALLVRFYHLRSLVFLKIQH